MPAGRLISFFFETTFNEGRIVRLRLQWFVGPGKETQHPPDRATSRRPDGDTRRPADQPCGRSHRRPADNPQRGAGAGVSAPIGPVLQTGAFRFLSAHRRVTCRLDEISE